MKTKFQSVRIATIGLSLLLPTAAFADRDSECERSGRFSCGSDVVTPWVAVMLRAVFEVTPGYTLNFANDPYNRDRAMILSPYIDFIQTGRFETTQWVDGPPFGRMSFFAGSALDVTRLLVPLLNLPGNLESANFTALPDRGIREGDYNAWTGSISNPTISFGGRVVAPSSEILYFYLREKVNPSYLCREAYILKPRDPGEEYDCRANIPVGTINGYCDLKFVPYYPTKGLQPLCPPI